MLQNSNESHVSRSASVIFRTNRDYASNVYRASIGAEPNFANLNALRSDVIPKRSPKERLKEWYCRNFPSTTAENHFGLMLFCIFALTLPILFFKEVSAFLVSSGPYFANTAITSIDETSIGHTNAKATYLLYGIVFTTISIMVVTLPVYLAGYTMLADHRWVQWFFLGYAILHGLCVWNFIRFKYPLRGIMVSVGLSLSTFLLFPDEHANGWINAQWLAVCMRTSGIAVTFLVTQLVFPVSARKKSLLLLAGCLDDLSSLMGPLLSLESGIISSKTALHDMHGPSRAGSKFRVFSFESKSNAEIEYKVLQTVTNRIWTTIDSIFAKLNSHGSMLGAASNEFSWVRAEGHFDSARHAEIASHIKELYFHISGLYLILQAQDIALSLMPNDYIGRAVDSTWMYSNRLRVGSKIVQIKSPHVTPAKYHTEPIGGLAHKLAGGHVWDDMGGHSNSDSFTSLNSGRGTAGGDTIADANPDFAVYGPFYDLKEGCKGKGIKREATDFHLHPQKQSPRKNTIYRLSRNSEGGLTETRLKYLIRRDSIHDVPHSPEVSQYKAVTDGPFIIWGEVFGPLIAQYARHSSKVLSAAASILRSPKLDLGFLIYLTKMEEDLSSMINLQYQWHKTIHTLFREHLDSLNTANKSDLNKSSGPSVVELNSSNEPSSERCLTEVSLEQKGMDIKVYSPGHSHNCKADAYAHRQFNDELNEICQTTVYEGAVMGLNSTYRNIVVDDICSEMNELYSAKEDDRINEIITDRPEEQEVEQQTTEHDEKNKDNTKAAVESPTVAEPRKARIDTEFMQYWMGITIEEYITLPPDARAMLWASFINVQDKQSRTINILLTVVYQMKITVDLIMSTKVTVDVDTENIRIFFDACRDLNIPPVAFDKTFAAINMKKE